TGNVTLPQTLGVSNFTLDYKGNADKRPLASTYYRRIRLRIDPVEIDGEKKYELSAETKVNEQGAFQEVLQPFVLDEMPPSLLKVGFAAATGGSTHIHEVRNLTITTTGGARVYQSVSKDEARVTDELVYTIEIINQTKTPADHLRFDALFPGEFVVSSIEFNKGDQGNTFVGWSEGDLQISNVILNLVPSGTATFTVRGKVIDVPDDQFLSVVSTLDVDQLIFPDP